MGAKQSKPPRRVARVARTPPPHVLGNYLLQRRFPNDEDAWLSHDVLLKGKSIADYREGREWDAVYRAWRHGDITPRVVPLAGADSATGGRGRRRTRHAYWQPENSWA